MSRRRGITGGEGEVPVEPTPVPAQAVIDDAPVENLKFADASFRMKWVCASIELGLQLFCKGWMIYHPHHFYVVLGRNWNALEAMQKKLDTFYKEKSGTNPDADVPPKDDDRFKLDASIKHAGLYVAAFHRKEWHRGLVLGCSVNKDNKHLCNVKMIDFGDHKEIPLNSVRHIPEGYLEMFPAQAIKCSLQFDDRAEPLNDRKYMWTAKEADVFQKMMRRCRFKVQFFRYYEEVDKNGEDILGNPLTWKCRVQKIIKNKKDKKKVVVDQNQIADLFVTELQRRFKKQEKEKKKKERKDKKKKKKKGTCVRVEDHGKKDKKDDDDSNSEPEDPDSWKILEKCGVERPEGLAGINMPLEKIKRLYVVMPSPSAKNEAGPSDSDKSGSI